MVQDQVAPSRFRVDQAATLADCVTVLVKGTTPELSLSRFYLRWTHFKDGGEEVFQPADLESDAASS